MGTTGAPKIEKAISRRSVERWNDLNNTLTDSQSEEKCEDRFGQIFKQVRKNLSQPSTPTKSNSDILKSISVHMDNEAVMMPHMQPFINEESTGIIANTHNGAELNSDIKAIQNDPVNGQFDVQNKSKASKMINFALRNCFKVLQFVEELADKLMADSINWSNTQNGALATDLDEINNTFAAITGTSPNWRPHSKIDLFLNKCMKLYMEIVYLVGLFEKTFYSLPKSQVNLMLELNRAIGELQFDRNCERIYGSTEERQMNLSRSLSDVSRNMEAFIVVLVHMKGIF